MRRHDGFAVDDAHDNGSGDEPDVRFADYLDGRMSPVEERAFAVALERDAALRARFESYRAVVDAVRETSDVDPPADLDQRILAAIAGERQPVVTPRRNLLPFLASLLTAAAAVTLFLVLLPEEGRRRGESDPSHRFGRGVVGEADDREKGEREKVAEERFAAVPAGKESADAPPADNPSGSALSGKDDRVARSARKAMPAEQGAVPEGAAKDTARDALERSGEPGSQVAKGGGGGGAGDDLRRFAAARGEDSYRRDDEERRAQLPDDRNKARKELDDADKGKLAAGDAGRPGAPMPETAAPPRLKAGDPSKKVNEQPADEPKAKAYGKAGAGEAKAPGAGGKGDAPPPTGQRGEGQRGAAPIGRLQVGAKADEETERSFEKHKDEKLSQQVDELAKKQGDDATRPDSRPQDGRQVELLNDLSALAGNVLTADNVLSVTVANPTQESQLLALVAGLDTDYANPDAMTQQRLGFQARQWRAGPETSGFFNGRMLDAAMPAEAPYVLRVKGDPARLDQVRAALPGNPNFTVQPGVRRYGEEFKFISDYKPFADALAMANWKRLDRDTSTQQTGGADLGEREGAPQTRAPQTGGLPAAAAPSGAPQPGAGQSGAPPVAQPQAPVQKSERLATTRGALEERKNADADRAAAARTERDVEDIQRARGQTRGHAAPQASRRSAVDPVDAPAESRPVGELYLLVLRVPPTYGSIDGVPQSAPLPASRASPSSR